MNPPAILICSILIIVKISMFFRMHFNSLFEKVGILRPQRVLLLVHWIRPDAFNFTDLLVILLIHQLVPFLVQNLLRGGVVLKILFSFLLLNSWWSLVFIWWWTPSF